jgi:riboflavin biosynthesis pyrimidine reductase
VEAEAPEVARVERELEALYGSTQLCRAGVVHVTHVARAPSGRLAALEIGPWSPHSPTDFFVLNLCRARADAILTSAENLRREPQLSHALQGPWAAALSAYRRALLGDVEAPLCAILTRSGALPQDHAVWSDGTRKLVLTSPEREAEVRARVGELARVLALEGLSARSACSWLTANGARLVSIEAGPSSARGLYEPPAQVDELLLTHWESAPPDARLAGELPEDDALFQGLRLAGSARRSEGSQSFRFERWVRTP